MEGRRIGLRKRMWQVWEKGTQSQEVGPRAGLLMVGQAGLAGLQVLRRSFCLDLAGFEMGQAELRETSPGMMG